MTQTIRVIYEDGVLKPLGPLALPENAELSVELRISGVENEATLPSSARISSNIADEKPSSRLPTLSQSPGAREITTEMVRTALEDFP